MAGRIVQFFAVALGLGLAAGPGLSAATTWTSAASPHFEVYTSAGDGRARDALAYFERAHAFFTSYLKLTPRQTEPTRLIVFSSDREYAPYRPNEFATAYYQPGPDRDTIVMRSLDADSLPVVAHEYMHLIIRYSGERFPVWLNEGLAEYFSTMSPEAGKMSVGRVPLGRLQYISDGGVRLMPLDALFVVTHDSPEYTTKTHAGTFYSESWALVHMLLSHDKYRPQSSAFLAAVSGGTPSIAALEATYGTTRDAVFQDLLAYVRQDRYRYMLVDYKMPPQDAKAPTRVVDEFEASIVTTSLLGASRAREAQARAAFDALAATHPDDVRLLEARGFFELRLNRPADARPYFERAVALGSTTPALLREYAIVITGSNPALAEDLLRRVLASSPDDLEARMRLANVCLVRRQGEAALAALAPVTVIPATSAYRFYYLVANASAMAGRLDEARQAAARAVAAARPGADAESAAELVANIERFAGQPSRVQAGRAGGTTTVTTIRDPNAPAEPKVTTTARITNFVCGSPLVLEVTTSSGAMRLLIESPSSVAMTSSGGSEPDLTCGKQDKPVRISYDPAVNAALKTDGIVRRLDFRK